MVSNIVNSFSTRVCDGWSWWWDGSIIEDGKARLAFTVVVAALVISWYAWLIKNFRKNKPPLPPGPRGLPLVGNLPFLEPDLHEYFAKLAKTYGPIFKLRLGNKLCVVLTSPSLAKEVFRDQDAICANRDAPIAGLTVTYGGSDIVWSQNGQLWRMLRKVLVSEMLSNTNLEACYALREREVRQTVREVYDKIGTPINIGEQMFLTILNVVMSMLWGDTLQGPLKTSIGAEFRKVVGEIVELLGKPNLSDIFPALARFDLQGIERQSKQLLAWFDKIFQSVIDQRLKLDKADGEQTSSKKESKDLLEFLLKLMERNDPKMPLTMIQLKGLLMDIVVGGTDTTSVSLEWAITEMMLNPDIMSKAQAELDEVVGMNNIVQESHLSRLHYLNAVVKETLRLHPAVPLLVPHCPSQSCIVGGYTVPKGARVFFNAWAMHRDSKEWKDPLRFQPERFLNNSRCDYTGNHFNYLPFGSGRRICAGIPLAERMLMYILASLIHSFEWTLPEGSKLDLSEEFGIVLKKKTPLVAIPTPRLSVHDLYK